MRDTSAGVFEAEWEWDVGERVAEGCEVIGQFVELLLHAVLIDVFGELIESAADMLCLVQMMQTFITGLVGSLFMLLLLVRCASHQFFIILLLSCIFDD